MSGGKPISGCAHPQAAPYHCHNLQIKCPPSAIYLLSLKLKLTVSIA